MPMWMFAAHCRTGGGDADTRTGDGVGEGEES